MSLKRENIVAFVERYRFLVKNKYRIRLHRHGLLRLIDLEVESDSDSTSFQNSIFLHNLIKSKAYQELFFDHFTQLSAGKHGPFIVNNISAQDYSLIERDHFLNEVIYTVSSPKWSCPPISKKALTQVRELIDGICNGASVFFFLDKCRNFNSSSQEAIIYEHEWSHSLSSYYEYVAYDAVHKRLSLLVITYE